MNIYTVLVTDRRSDPGVETYKSERAAFERAIKLANEYCHYQADYNENVTTTGIFAVEYSCEGDRVTVYKTELL